MDMTLLQKFSARNLLKSLHVASLHNVGSIIATQKALKNAFSGVLRIHSVFQDCVRCAESCEHLPSLVGSSGNVVLWTIWILDRQTIGPLVTTVDIVSSLANDGRGVHLYTLRAKVELVAVIIKEPQEAVTKVVRLLAMLEIADDKTDDREASNTTCVDLVHAAHNEKLFQQRDHVDHVRIILLPLLECRLCLNPAKVLK